MKLYIYIKAPTNNVLPDKYYTEHHNLNRILYPESESSIADLVSEVRNLFEYIDNNNKPVLVITQSLFLLREIYIQSQERIIEGIDKSTDYLYIDINSVGKIHQSNDLDNTYDESFLSQLVDTELDQSDRWMSINDRLAAE